MAESADQIVVDRNAPDWRWMYVSRLREGSFRLSRAHPDFYVRRAYRYAGAERRAVSPNEKFQLATEFTEMHAAKVMHRSAESERWMLEAAILGNAPVEEISSYLAQPIEVIDTYEKVFYDIREKLGARGYILNRILLPSFRRGLMGRDMDLLPKIISYCAGWEAAKEFIDVTQLGTRTRDWLRLTFRDRILKNAWNAAHRIEVNQFNAVEVMGVLIQIDMMDKSGDQALMKDEALQQITKLFGMAPTTARPADELLAIDEPRVMDQLAGKALEMYVAPPVDTTTPVEVRDGAPGQSE